MITNSWADLSLQISFMNLHYLEHGGLAVSASERIDPIGLETILQPAVTLALGESGVTLRWRGRSGRTYQVFVASRISGPWTPGPTFGGDGSELVLTDPDITGQPRKFYQVRMQP